LNLCNLFTEVTISLYIGYLDVKKNDFIVFEAIRGLLSF